MSSQPAGHDVELWSVALDDDERLTGDGAAVLSVEESEQAATLWLDRDRRRYVASRVCLRRLLGDRLGTPPQRIVLSTGVHGKPELARPDSSGVTFSLSRSGGLALIGLSVGTALGVDIEQCLPLGDLAAVARGVFSPGEREWLATLEGEAWRQGFFRLWARKESFVKAVGVGVGVPLSAVDITGDFARLLRAVPEIPVGNTSWSVRDLEVAPGFAAAVTVQGEGADASLIVRRFDPAQS